MSQSPPDKPYQGDDLGDENYHLRLHLLNCPDMLSFPEMICKHGKPSYLTCDKCDDESFYEKGR